MRPGTGKNEGVRLCRKMLKYRSDKWIEAERESVPPPSHSPQAMYSNREKTAGEGVKAPEQANMAKKVPVKF